MEIIQNSSLETFELPGIYHKTIAGPDQEVRQTEVWKQSLAPGTETPVHYHDCEEIVIILKGSGILVFEGEDHEFEAGTTLVTHPEDTHQLKNTGVEEMELIAVLGEANPGTFTPDDDPIPLPWD